jgi:hypothetical protein
MHQSITALLLLAWRWTISFVISRRIGGWRRVAWIGRRSGVIGMIRRRVTTEEGGEGRSKGNSAKKRTEEARLMASSTRRDRSRGSHQPIDKPKNDQGCQNLHSQREQGRGNPIE